MVKIKEKNNRGFSLIELIVVIAILATVIAVIAPQFGKYISTSKASTDMQNFQRIKTAVEVFYTDKGTDGSESFLLEVTNGMVTITGQNVEEIFTNAALDVDFKLESNTWFDVEMKYIPSNNKWDIKGKNSIDTETYDLSELTN